MSKVTVALVLTILIAAVPAFGQEKGAFELGAFGKVAFFDGSLNYDPAFGGGLRAGYYFLHNLMFEVDGAIAAPDDQPLGKSDYWPFHGRLIYALPLSGKASLLMGGGYTHNAWGKALSGSEDGFGALVGLRWNLSEKWAIRVDGIGDYLPSPVNGADNNTDWGIQAGLSFLIPVARSQDSDLDGDGVLDQNDRCPYTPKGAEVDANGCPLDSDGDGVLDQDDRCPDTPKGVKVDATGCPVPLDSDGDGVLDQNDRCPDTPKGVKVDATGCPLDSDGDGVLDQDDRCPDTPKGVKVDAAGCPITIILEGVNFATNSDQLTPEAKTALDLVAGSLVARSDVRIEIAGYTDNQGSRAYNLRLSQKRAESVRNYLISKGVPAENIEAKSYGPDQPIASNDTPEGRARNRRVEMHQLK
jgi:OOP family OmpA-OmpF porin